MSELRRTPLADAHRALGARMVSFAGFEMPVQYGSIFEEHRAVRERAGLFDVSHMGQIQITGPGALAASERLVTCPVASLAVGQVRYGLLCNERGGVVDDVTVYRLAEEVFFFCVNAANIEKDVRWMRGHAGPGARVENRSAGCGLLALQGPLAADVLRAVSPLPPPGMKRFRFVEGEVAGVRALVSRTGYTGADGYELYVEADRLGALWSALLDAGRPLGILPAGLGARDTLRLEAALPLYGHELDDETSPFEAGLDRFVKPSGYVGAEAMSLRAAAGLTRRLAGFVVEDRAVARMGHALLHDGAEIGRVTSGAPSPSLGKPIGLGYVPPRLAQPGTRLAVAIRDRPVPAVVVETPFVR